MITCPSCGHENQQSAVECAKCSTNILWALENLITSECTDPLPSRTNRGQIRYEVKVRHEGLLS